ncbi:MAG: membrane protein insertase YidC [Deltaproteobacteria bacterium]|nr:membrane protein insertase YidC [Deltaproteobacteria bacterium]
MDKRTILAIVLSLILVMGYQYLFLKKPAPEPGQPATVQATSDVTVKKDVTADKTITTEPPSPEKSIVKKADIGAVGKDIKVITPLYTAIFNTRGAALKSFKLKNYNVNVKKDSGLVELVTGTNDMDYPLSLSFSKSSINIASNLIYETNQTTMDLTKLMNEKKLIFTRSFPEEVTIEKIFTFYPDKYTFDLEVRVVNLSKEIFKQSALLSWNQYAEPEAKSSRYYHEGPISYIKNDVETEKIKNLGPPKILGPDISWAGYESKYFIASAIPQQPSLTNLVISKDSQNIVSVSLEGPKNIILPGQTGTFHYNLYLGPKDYSILKGEGVGLENSINFGSWLKWLALPLLTALKYIYHYVHNYGIAILILTVLVKILFWPLGNISYRSMKQMQNLQPKIEAIREKYKGDKTKVNQEVMALYKSYKVNPMSGCLPMLIQLPVFLGLYKALLYSIELRHSPFFFWIQDLSAKDPYYITPIIMGATMFLQQKMSPAPSGDQMQAKMMMWMPVIFTFMFLSFPSGLVIYWLFNNVISIGQQYYVNKRTS